VQFPITVKAENTSINLQSGEGQSITLKEGEEIIFHSLSSNKLMISEDIIPEAYILEQNFPNPFNPSTTITFSLPEKSDNLRLSIYDSIGQRVAELINSSFEAGKYNYSWNASEFSSGIYFYELQTEKFRATKKMVLIK
jgi:hypothetical protein